MRWALVFLLATLVFNFLHGLMTKIGLGRLPGDFSFKLRGRCSSGRGLAQVGWRDQHDRATALRR